MSFKRGRLPARHNRHTMRGAIAMARALDALGSPPVVSDDYVTPLVNALNAPGVGRPSGGTFGMYLNDQLGDCVCADSAHQVLLHTACSGQIVIPTQIDVLDLYENVGGYKPSDPSTDQGCDETSMCQYLMTTGLTGQKSAGSGMVDPTRLDHVRWAVQLFGACRLGIIVDDAMEQEFSSKQPWTNPAAANDPSAGGHDVPIVKYDADYAYVVTWGELQPVAWALLGQPAFLDEAHAEVWPDFIAATGSAPNGFSLQQLLADLPELEEAA